ncbi:Minf_1886 family protein [Polystyrenella longa]|nr:Minf_1886 family protein [Polystyrenella longa]
MSTTSQRNRKKLSYHPQAYHFVFQSLRYMQDKLDKLALDANEEGMHISGPELLIGIKELALKQYGLLTSTVFEEWGISTTDDFGRIVFELIEHGEMRKTDRDRLEDFFGVYQFNTAFDKEYEIDVAPVFRKKIAS